MPPPSPPRLEHLKPPQRWRTGRLIVLVAAQAVGLLLLAWLLDGVKLLDFRTGVYVVLVLAVLNAVMWPLVVRLALPLVIWTVGLFTLVLNGLFVSAVAALVDGFDVGSVWSGLVVAVGLSAVNLAVGGLLSINDDHAWRQIVVRRMVSRTEPPEPTTVPGILFIQIDGLGAEVLEEAMAAGHAPALASLVERGTHQLLHWECDLSSQTGAMQAGIMFGDNSDMPAFRWYEKETGRVMVSNRARDAAEIEARQSNGSGLLVDGGASRGNVFSGDAADSMFTFSTVLGGRHKRGRFVYLFSTPFALLRIFLLSVVDIGREIRAALRAKRKGIEPRMHRGGVYPLLRAATTVVLAEITYGILISDIERGVPSAYVDLVGYDEVAHHSGISAPESLDTLERIDDQLRRLLGLLQNAPRPYFVVILSDHGQTQGSTFLQRYDESLDALVKRLARDAAVNAPALAEEGWNNVNGLLSDAAADESRIGKTVALATRRRTVNGEVVLGPETEVDVESPDDIVVLASGNLGLLSFPAIDGRASRQQIDRLHPGLIEGVRTHTGIGLVLVRDEEAGDIVLGPDGIHHLDDGRVDGTDPLAPFGPNAADHLRRTSSFGNCPDLLVNSFYDRESDEGAAFEELIGFHGGLGGKQCRPFVLAPASLPVPDEPLVGAAAIHRLFKSWLALVSDGKTPEVPTEPA